MEYLVVCVIVAVAAFFTGWKFYRSVTGKDSGCGCACAKEQSCCGAHHGAPHSEQKKE
jgi:hypothetical protein